MYSYFAAWRIIAKFALVFIQMIGYYDKSKC